MAAHSPARTLAFYGDKVDELGSGAFGEINMYEDDQGNRTAVKTTYPQKSDSFSMNNILHEVVFPKMLSHPNIIAYYDVFLESVNSVTIVMPLATGALIDVLQTSYFTDPKRIQRLAGELVSAVAYLTKHNILHCDIKPENVLGFLEDGVYTFKLADFGLAQDRTCLTANSNLHIYALWYRPPEILNPRSTYTEHADVWALGCTLYEVLGRDPLFAGANNERQMLKYIDAYFGPLATKTVLDKESPFENLLASMLIVDPKVRITIFDAQTHEYFSDLDRQNLGIPYVDNVACFDRHVVFNSTIANSGLEQYEAQTMTIILEWITELVEETVDYVYREPSAQTLALAKTLFLTCISKTVIPKHLLQAYACAAVYLAVNWLYPKQTLTDIEYYVSSTSNLYTELQIERAIIDTLSYTNWGLVTTTPYDLLKSELLRRDITNPRVGQLAMIILSKVNEASWYIKPELGIMCLDEVQFGSQPDLRAVILADQTDPTLSRTLTPLWRMYTKLQS